MHNYHLLESLKNNMDVLFISSQINKNASYYSEKKIKFSSISNYLPLFYWRFVKSKFLQNGLRSLQDWQISIAMAKALDSHPANVIEFMDVHSEGYSYLRKNPANFRKTKVVIRSHTPWGLLRSYYSHEERRGFDGWWSFEREKYCFHNCDSITVPSIDLKDQLITLYNLSEEKITVIPNIIDIHHFTPLPKPKKTRFFTILHVGRFERPKGVITLTRAFIEFAKINKDCRLIMVGQARGSSHEHCIRLLKNAGLIEKVQFSGFVSYDDLPKYYAKADVVVVPSEIYESFSYTVAQAISCNKPVIASKIGGIPETLDHGRCGLLFHPGKNNELFNMLSYVYENPNKVSQISNDARDYAINNFSQEKLAPIYKDFYQTR